jgi:hypothetical protein
MTTATVIANPNLTFVKYSGGTSGRTDGESDFGGKFVPGGCASSQVVVATPSSKSEEPFSGSSGTTLPPSW